MNAITFEAFSAGMTKFKELADSKYTLLADLPVYTIQAQVAPESGYASTYQLYRNDEPVGVKINIPKDYLVKSATLHTVVTTDTPVVGYRVGDCYVDFAINTKSNDGTASHIYLLVNDLIDTYTGANGIAVNSSGVASLVIDTPNANGLSVGANGLALALVTSSTSGAMSSADKAKLDSLSYMTENEGEDVIEDLFEDESEDESNDGAFVRFEIDTFGSSAEIYPVLEYPTPLKNVSTFTLSIWGIDESTTVSAQIGFEEFEPLGDNTIDPDSFRVATRGGGSNEHYAVINVTGESPLKGVFHFQTNVYKSSGYKKYRMFYPRIKITFI